MESSKNNKPNKPKNSSFKQQRLKGWRCSPSTKSLGYIYIALGLLFIIFGAIILSESNKVKEIRVRYDDIEACQADWRTPHTCLVPLPITEDIESPIFFYFEIKNMYQNHRKYNKSRDIYQLMGDLRSVSEIDKYCDPIVDMQDLGFYTTLNISSSAPANPCGLVAKSYFNDTYSIVDSSYSEIPMTSNGIAWDIDKEQKFKKSENSEEVQWIDVENGKVYLEHFIVWMSTAGLPKFRKLWGRIDQDLAKGDYNVVIVNNYDVSSFQGQKFFVVSTTSFFGGKNEFLGVIFIIVGIIALLGSGLIFASLYFKKKRQQNLAG